MNADLAGAFLAGLLSFLSPCVLPLVPSYIAYITGMSGAGEIQARRHLALLHALLFVIGFTLIFVALGATATAFGRVLHQYRQWLERARSRQRLRPRAASTWPVGAHVLWRGEHQEIRKASEGPRPTVSIAADGMSRRKSVEL